MTSYPVIKLGVPGALRNYSLKQQGNGIAWRRGPADPFAAKVNSSSKYDEVDAWNEWAQEDWQAGVGRIDPTEGGFLFAETETRVPNQIILPAKMQQGDRRTLTNTIADCRYIPDNVAGTITVGTGGYAKVAMQFTTPASTTAATGSMYFYARFGGSTDVKVSVYTNSAGAPNVSSHTGTATYPATNGMNFAWQVMALALEAGASTSYWLVLEVGGSSATASFELAYGSSGYDAAMRQWTGAAWAAVASTYFVFSSNYHVLEDLGNTLLFRFNSNLYLTAQTKLFKTTTTVWSDTADVLASDATSVAVFGPNAYIGHASGNFEYYDTSEVIHTGATTGTLFIEYKGLLYRTVTNSLYYSNDGTTWSAAYTVGGSDSQIRGMAGMGDSLYLATDKALFRFAPGNVVEEVTRFGAEDSANGVGMIEYNGRLYIPSAGRLFRFDLSGQMMDIWLTRSNDFPSLYIGPIKALAKMNNWLLAWTQPSTGFAGALGSVWMWQEEGWHFLGQIPHTGTGSEIVSMLYDRSTSKVWIAPHSAGPFYFSIDDYTLNPYNSTTYLYQPFGWIEQDRFYGGQWALNKDFESVRIYGDNFSSGVCVKVYWQDEGSTTWESLGTVTADGQEVRWAAPYSTRPQGKWIKLGLLLQTNNGLETPRIRAVVLKNLPMVNDRISDTVTVVLSNYIQLSDGTLDTYTLLQQQTHIQSMITSIVPIIYEDPFGTQYEVKVADYSLVDTIFSYENSARVIKELEYVLVLRQINDAVYA